MPAWVEKLLAHAVIAELSLSPTQVRGTSQGVPAARRWVLGKFPGRRGRKCQPETATGPDRNALGEDGRPRLPSPACGGLLGAC